MQAGIGPIVKQIWQCGPIRAFSLCDASLVIYDRGGRLLDWPQ